MIWRMVAAVVVLALSAAAVYLLGWLSAAHAATVWVG